MKLTALYTERSTFGKIGIWVAGVLVALFIIGSVVPPESDDEPVTKSSAAKAPAATKTTPTAKAKSKAKAAKPKAKATAESKMTKGIHEVDDKAKVEVSGGNVTVRNKYPEGLTQGNARGNSQRDITEMLKAVDSSGWSKKHPSGLVTVEQEAPLVDKLGNESDEMVVSVSYTGKLISEINFDNFDPTNSWEIATDKFIHYAIR